MSEASAARRLDQLLAPFAPDKPGLAALVTVGGEVVFERYLGGADLEHGVGVTGATRFHVASVSKQFTAFAVLLEVEGAGGISPVDAPPALRSQEAKLAYGWFNTIISEIFG